MDVKAFKLPGGKVKWEHFQKVYEYCQQFQLSNASHLKEEWLYNLTSFMKMRVQPARAVLGHATACAIRVLNKHKPDEFPDEFLVSAHFCDFIGEWRELINNRKRSMAMVANNEELTAFRKGRIIKFKEVYIRMKLHKRQKEKLKDSQKGVILATYSMIWLTDKLLIELKFHFFLTAKGNTDVVEAHHSDARSIHSSPTCRQYKQDCKIMSVTHYMGHVKNSNYDIDETGFFLSDLDAMKEIVKENEEEDNLVIDLAKAHFFAPPDFTEKLALASFGAWVIQITIVCTPHMKRLRYDLRAPKCEICLRALTINHLEDDQEVNDLIAFKEYKGGLFVHPSELANEMFYYAEQIFRQTWKQLDRQRGLNQKLTDAIVSACCEKFENLPRCHLPTILGKFVEVRLYFYADYIDKKMQKKHKSQIFGAANASKSTKSAALTKIPDKKTHQQIRKERPTEALSDLEILNKSHREAERLTEARRLRKAKKVKPSTKSVTQKKSSAKDFFKLLTEASSSATTPKSKAKKVQAPIVAKKRKKAAEKSELIDQSNESIENPPAAKRSKRVVKKPSRFLDMVRDYGYLD